MGEKRDKHRPEVILLTLNNKGVLAPADLVLADSLAADYFPDCGGDSVALGLATKKEVARLLEVCRQSTVCDLDVIEKAVDVIRRCSEQELNRDVLAVLVEEDLFDPGEGEYKKHSNTIVRIVARICFLCAVGRYISG